MSRLLNLALGPVLARELSFPEANFAEPAGEPGLVGPGSVSWRIFRNPVAVAVGGIAAVLIELGEPRVRSGVWEHSAFRSEPKARMRRTALGAMISVYGARSLVQRYTAQVNALHASVIGRTPAGQPYRADDPDLLLWVAATAAYGFAEAYHRLVRPLSPADRDRFLEEAAAGAIFYGVAAAPRSWRDLQHLLADWAPRLEPSPIIREFLAIIRSGRILPGAARILQPLLARAAIDLLPPVIAERIGCSVNLRSGERALLRLAARTSEKVDVADAPWAQAERRLRAGGGARPRS